MFNVATSLMPGLDRADREMTTASRALANANTGDTDTLGAAMASSAHAALFGEALMNAVHARMAEIKAVTK